MFNEFFNNITEIIKEYNLTTSLSNFTYYIEFKSNTIFRDNINIRYVLTLGGSKKKNVYNAMFKIHKIFNIDTTHLEKTNFKELENYKFYIKDFKIEGVFKKWTPRNYT